MKRKSGWWFSFFVILIASSAIGGEQENFSDYFFHRGQYETALTSGVMFSPIGADKNRHTVDYTLTGLQFGWMLSDLKEAGWLRGNWELSAELFGGAVYKGRGTYIAGGTAWLRYNFVPPNWRVTPFIQFGAGAEATDMDQRLIGQKFDFNLDVAAGVRCFVARNWSLDLECRYQHISNAKLNKHDVGINAVGPMVGLSYFF